MRTSPDVSLDLRGVGVNHELRRSFRNESGAFLYRLLTQSLTALVEEGLIELDEMATDGTKVRASGSRARYEREPAREPQCLKDWHARMASDAGKTVYARRSRTEHPHRRMKNCGFGRMLVRGLKKVQTVCLLYAVPHNLILAAARGASRAARVAA